MLCSGSWFQVVLLLVTLLAPGKLVPLSIGGVPTGSFPCVSSVCID